MEESKNLNKYNSISSSIDSNNNSSKKGLKMIAKIIIGGIILAFIGGGIALGFHIWDPLWNPFGVAPERVIGKMFDKMKEVKTFHSNVNIAMKTTGGNPSEILINLDSNSDISDYQNRKIETNFDIQVKEEKTGDLHLKGKIKEIKDISYFKLDEIDFPSELNFYLMMFGVDKEKFIGQWFKINKKTLENINNKSGQSKLSKNEQKEIKRKIEDLFKERKIYHAKKMSDEKIQGKIAYHYILSLDKKSIKEIIPELLDTIKNSPSNKKSNSNVLESLGTVDTERIKQSIDQFFDKINGLSIDIWIGKKDYLLYRAKMDKRIEINNSKGENNNAFTINFDLKMSNFNELVKIEAPEKFLDLNDLLSSLESKLQKAENIPVLP